MDWEIITLQDSTVLLQRNLQEGKENITEESTSVSPRERDVDPGQMKQHWGTGLWDLYTRPPHHLSACS